MRIIRMGCNGEIRWTPAQDDGPYQFYEIWMVGSHSFNTGKNITSATVQFLEPATAYTFQVRAYDYGNNRSPFSDPVSVTTLAPNPNDTTPPTTPTDLPGGDPRGRRCKLHGRLID